MVSPVFHPYVKKLKNKPDKNGNKSSKNKYFKRFRKKRRFCHPEIYTVKDQNKGPPGKGIEPSFYKRNIKNEEKCRKSKYQKSCIQIEP